MPVVLQTRQGNLGYRHQLDRVRRFLGRIQGQHQDEVEYQDLVWSFFQHCWHLNDWVRHDPVVPAVARQAVWDEVQKCDALLICRDMACATKHLKLADALSGTGAGHQYVEMTATGRGVWDTMDCVIYDGRGNLVSGTRLARECVSEWERILAAAGLGTTPL